MLNIEQDHRWSLKRISTNAKSKWLKLEISHIQREFSISNVPGLTQTQWQLASMAKEKKSGCPKGENNSYLASLVGRMFKVEAFLMRKYNLGSNKKKAIVNTVVPCKSLSLEAPSDPTCVSFRLS